MKRFSVRRLHAILTIGILMLMMPVALANGESPDITGSLSGNDLTQMSSWTQVEPAPAFQASNTVERSYTAALGGADDAARQETGQPSRNRELDERLDPIRTWKRDQAPRRSNLSVSWSNGSASHLEASRPSTPVMLRIPSLAIDARVEPVGVGNNGAMQVPDDLDTVGWYRYGPAPGQSGSAVIAGHLDDEYGRSIFFDLSKIESGSEIIVGFDSGEQRRFEVTDKLSYPSTELPRSLFSRDGDSVVALVTCGGVWDRDAGRYSEAVVVYASPVDRD